jgi:hypothetical protein
VVPVVTEEAPLVWSLFVYRTYDQILYAEDGSLLEQEGWVVFSPGSFTECAGPLGLCIDMNPKLSALG